LGSGAYSAPPDPLAVFKGPISKVGREGKGRGREEEGKEGVEKEGRRREGPPPQIFWPKTTPDIMASNGQQLSMTSAR